MTDLRHIAQLLHEAGRRPRASARRRWPPGCGRRIHDADRDTENEERGRRLESDAEAVQVHHHPPQQGPGVPDRLLPLPVGRLRPSRATCPVFHDPDNGNAPHHRRRGTTGNELRAPPEDGARGGAGRGPAPALRRPDPGPAPGGALVGRRAGQPALAAGPAALRPGPDGVVAAVRRQAPSDADAAVEARRALGPRVVGGAGRRPPCGALARRTADARRSSRRRASTAPSTPSGGGRRTRASPGRCTSSRPSAASPSGRRSPSTRRCRPSAVVARSDADRTPDEAGARSPCGWPTCPAAPWSGPSSTACLERLDFDAPDLTPRSARRSATRSRGATSTSGTPTRWSPGLCAAIESPARSAGRRHVRCATSPGGTGSTSWASRSRSSGATTPTRRDAARGGRWPTCSSAPAGGRPGGPLRRRAARPGARPASLRGYLTGSLDLVLRLAGRPLRPGRLQDEQARRARRDAHRLALPPRRRSRPRWWRPTTRCRPCSTAVALHRYLRWRLPGYDPARHLGGVLYLFVRGMSALEPTVRRRARRAASGRGARRPRWSRR